MNESDFALVKRPSSATEKVVPGAKRILSGMVLDTLALTKRASRFRIIVVNDEPAPLKSFEIIIRSWFKDVTLLLFESSSEAWEELSKADPDLLITDDKMPGLTGEDIVRRLVIKKVTYPIIVNSPWEPTEQWVRECANRGLNISFLPAPFETASLRKLVEAGLKPYPEIFS